MSKEPGAIHRQQVLSLLIHYGAMDTDYFNRTYGIAALDPEALVERAIEHGWDYAIGWLEGWLEAGDTLDVRFTTFEEMKTDPVNFVTRLVQHYGGPADEFDGRAAVTRIEEPTIVSARARSTSGAGYSPPNSARA